MSDSPLQHRNTVVAVWLLLCCALVFAMVTLGGVTRLTGSGLSIVEWQPVTGVLPPLNDADWAKAFADYQRSPEFQKINHAMDVTAFKEIFWLEYLHRLLGRMIGIVFLLPMIYFFWRGTIAAREWPKYVLMFGLGGLQGVLGWYMVKSGLIDNPHVSQYRLTAHLVAAFLIYAYMFWVALGLLFGSRAGPRERWFAPAVALTALIATTVISGGFVAGLKAGFAFNTFPLMGGAWVPPGLYTFEPAWRNLFENIVTVQFNHRVLALTTLLMVSLFAWFSRLNITSARARRGVRVMFGLACVQVGLGIATLLLHVPIPLAAAHQATALLLFTSALYVCHGLRGAGA